MEIEFSDDDVPFPERVAELQDMTDALRQLARKDLNAWERGFLVSIEAHLATNGFLTPRQVEKLEELHAKHLG
jgi:hypothetical protein